MDRRSFLAQAVSAASILRINDWVPDVSALCGSASRRSAGGSAQIVERSVREFGARGDGVTDDTSAFDKAFGALPKLGGTITVPDGIYQIDATRSVRPRLGVTLHLSARAILRAIPTTQPHSAVLLIAANGVRILGGTVLGERDRHRGTGGEWGMGIDVRSSTSVVVDGVHIADCWGDGIYIGVAAGSGESREITIQNCTVTNNRRQGLSVTGAVGVLVQDCTFSGTGGTAPQCGIDLEPNGSKRVESVRIRRCRVSDNAGSGIVLSGPGSNSVRDITLEGNVVSRNRLQGIGLAQVADCVLTRNTVTENGDYGIMTYRDVTNVQILANTVRGNSRSSPSRFDNILLQNGASGNLIADNIFDGPHGAGDGTPAFDIRIATRDCVGNRLLRNHTRLRAQGSKVPGILDHGAATVLTPAS